MFKKTLISLMALFSLAVMLGGCETMKGAGKDIENAGEEIQEEAE